MSDWQPIETAPTKQAVLVCEGQRGAVVAVHFGIENGWLTRPGRYQVYPTHWMPLPDPPTEVAARPRQEPPA